MSDLLRQFSDVLLYANKSTASQMFRVLGHVPVRSMVLESGEHNAFVIHGGQHAITVSAGTTAEKHIWLADISRAIIDYKLQPSQLSIRVLDNFGSFYIYI